MLSKISMDLSADAHLQAKEYPFEVFLCGPSLKSKKPSSKFRNNIRKELEKEGFTVVLGEDEGIKKLTKMFNLDAQSSEIKYVNTRPCRAIIIIADSVGTLCELGLFNWLYMSGGKNTFSQDRIDFYVFLDQQYSRKRNYLNLGPIKHMKSKSNIIHTDFISYNIHGLVQEFVNRRINLSVNDLGGI